MVNEYKTISQIEEETTTLRHFRAFDFARAVALTEFLKGLEVEYGNSFRIITARPLLLKNRNIEESEQVFTFGLWVRFDIDKIEYYVEINENPFFDAYITKSYRIDNKTAVCEYANSMNDIFYSGVDWNAEPDNIKLITTNIREAYKTTQKRAGNTYIHKIPAGEINKKQIIYVG